MKLWEVIRFELGYHARRPWTWVYFAVLFGLSFQIVMEAYTGNARDLGYYFNAPFVIAAITVLASAMGLLTTAAIAGDAAARDVQTRMLPLMFTTPVGRRTYILGRFLAAYIISALMMLAPQLALLLSLVMPDAAPILGPVQPAAYALAFLIIAVPNAFVMTALLFTVAALSRRAIASYLAASIFFFFTLFVHMFLGRALGRWELAKLLEPLGVTIIGAVSESTIVSEKNSLSVLVNAGFLLHHAIWLTAAMLVLIVLFVRFRFEHAHTRAGRRTALPEPVQPRHHVFPIALPERARTSFGARTRLHQVWVIAIESFRAIAFSWGGALLLVLSAVLVAVGPTSFQHMGLNIIPTTAEMVGFVGNTGELMWLIVPMLTAFYAGELVWREREAGIGDISDAAPAPVWTRMIGRWLGVAMLLAAYQFLLIFAAMAVQAQLGYTNFEPGLYARVMLGLQLSDHLLFAALAFAVHIVVNHKYAGHMVLILAYAATMFASYLGVEHKLLIYGAAPEWSYTQMRGFGPTLMPHVWFKLFWSAIALLLGLVGALLWVHGRELDWRMRLRTARQRATRRFAVSAALVVSAVLLLGGFVFYNTNVLNPYLSEDDVAGRRAAYERRFARFAYAPQPEVTAMTLNVELFPAEQRARIAGVYTLVNFTGRALDSLHIATQPDVTTGAIDISSGATLALSDDRLGHRTYVLSRPLAPNDSIRLTLDVRYHARGFANTGARTAVSSDATFFDGRDWLPQIGYDRSRELSNARDRRKQDLPAREPIPLLEDARARADASGTRPIVLETVISTAPGQTAFAPGTLIRNWNDGGRAHFHYRTESRIRPDFAFFSALYARHTSQWRDVPIEIVHHPEHTSNVEEMAKGVRASLDYLTAQFSPFPHRQIRLIEYPALGNSLHAYPINVSYQEGFALFQPDTSAATIHFPFAVVAHETAHEWWGSQLTPAYVQGAGVLTEGLAWYSAFLVLRQTYGQETLDRFLRWMHDSDAMPSSRAGPPLLRGHGWLANYRMGPFALYSLSEHVGEDKVNAALRTLLRKHPPATQPLATSLDLYRELKAVTPDSLRPLLHDLFAANTFWELAIDSVKAEPMPGTSRYRVTIDVTTNKVAADTAGVQTRLPMNDLVEIGVYGEGSDRALRVERRRLTSGAQRIVMIVDGKPATAGIDPRQLLVDDDRGNNWKDVDANRPVRR